MYYNIVKRILDIFISIIIIILLFPFIIIILILVRIKLGSPVFFIQIRPGYKEKLFKMYKFRTMTNEKDNFGVLLNDEKRLTKFGKYLRETSIDELPELINVIKGDMSLVGPRPLLVEYLKLYSAEQKKRHDVKPGITGMAQVNGRNSISWEDKFIYDLWYVKNKTIVIDIKILLKTIANVVQKKHINKDGYSTTDMFKGS
jgi:lipopolysaccharide/colanic/teichoic acid biosynthesis glycosyltransferase